MSPPSTGTERTFLNPRAAIARATGSAPGYRRIEAGIYPVGIGIAMEHPAEKGSDDRQVPEVHTADEPVGRFVEIERQGGLPQVREPWRSRREPRQDSGHFATRTRSSPARRSRRETARSACRPGRTRRPDVGGFPRCQLNHPRRDIEADDTRAAGRQRERDIACARRQIESATPRERWRQGDQPLLPPAILSVPTAPR